MQAYHNLLEKIMSEGVEELNERTGKICSTLVGEQLTFDMTSFPLLETRPMPIKSIIGELLSFFRGYTSADKFRELGCKFWDANANETPNWLKNKNRKGTDDLGRIYGAQWTGWRDTRIIGLHEIVHYANTGYKIKCHKIKKLNPEGSFYVLERHINQLMEVLKKLITDPSDRRMIITAWNPAELDLMSLPSCHIDYRFTAIKNTVNCVMTMRSCDAYLGLPANIAETGLLLKVMAGLSGFDVGKIVIQLANVHLYSDHYSATLELLNRKPNPASKVQINISNLISYKSQDFSLVPQSVFSDIEPDYFEIVDYNPLGKIGADAPMAV